MFNCGAMPSPADERDYQFASIGGAMAIIEPYQSVVPIGQIWNQGASSQCGGCAGTYYRREREYMQNGDGSRFSHTYVYGSDDEFGGEGMYGRTLAKVLYRGIPHEQKWEAWNTKAQAQTVVAVHKKELADECHLFRCSSYYFCKTWTEVLNAIRTCNGCVLMVPCYDNWSDPVGGIVGANKGNLWGYHFVFAKDYERKPNGAFRIRFVNSWGYAWGDGGCGYLDTDVNTFQEAFALVDDVDEVKRMLNFVDVNEGDWYKPYVEKVVQSGLMNGIDAATFDPNGTVTRAQLAAVLARLADKIGI